MVFVVSQIKKKFDRLLGPLGEIVTSSVAQIQCHYDNVVQFKRCIAKTLAASFSKSVQLVHNNLLFDIIWE